MKTEQELIGSVLTYEKCLINAIENLKKKHFLYYAPVWGMIAGFYQEGRDHEDLVYDVMQECEKDGVEFHGFIEMAKPSVTSHIEIIIDRWERRIVEEISNSLYTAQKEEPDLKSEVMKSIQSLSDLIAGDSKREQTMKEVMADSMDFVERVQAGEETGLMSGLDLDKITMGFQKGQFYILAARPSMGKTALAVQISSRIAQDVPVGILSLETTNKSLGLRFLSNHSNINSEQIRSGRVNIESLKVPASNLSDLPIVIDDTTDISSEGIRAKVNSMKRKHGIEFLVIDYVQLMKSSKDNREQQVADISRACVAIAKEFDICVFGLAQLNRGVEARGGDKRPMLSDLRESGQLEQDAFCVMLLHRPEYYGITNYPDGKPTDKVAEVIIAKHKDGKTGVKKLFFEKETMRFENLQPF